MKLQTINKINDITNVGLISSGTAFLATGADDPFMHSLAACFFTLLVIEEISKNKIYKTSDEYKKIKPLYDEIILRTAKLMKKINATKPTEIYTVFNYLLRNGFLSENEFAHTALMNNFNDIPYIYGVDVVSGNAVCRHISPMLSDILKECDLNSGILNVQTKNDKGISSNHIITRVDDSQKIYTFDPTNKMFLRGKNKMYNILTNEYEMKKHFTSKKIYDNLTGTNFYRKNQSLTEANVLDYLEQKKSANIKIEYNYDLIDNFYLNNGDLYKEIVDELENNNLSKKRKII